MSEGTIQVIVAWAVIGLCAAWLTMMLMTIDRESRPPS